MIAGTFEMSFARASMCLEAGRGLSLKDAAGVVLTSLAGRVWLTMEGDTRDIDLRPGVAYTIERDGLTLVSALEPSLVEVRVPEGKVAPWRGWLEGGWAWLARAGEGRARARMASGLQR